MHFLFPFYLSLPFSLFPRPSSWTKSNSYKSFTKPINPNTCVIICTVPQGVDAILYRFLEVCVLSLPITLDTNDLLICYRSEIYQFKHPTAKYWNFENNNIRTSTVWKRFSPHVRSLIFWFFTLQFVSVNPFVIPFF